MAPVATRSISNDSDGMIWPCASITIGTRRTMPSRSVRMLNRPRPGGGVFEHRHVPQQPRKAEQVGFGSPPSVATPTGSGCCPAAAARRSAGRSRRAPPRDFLMASAITSSLLGKARELVLASPRRDRDSRPPPVPATAGRARRRPRRRRSRRRRVGSAGDHVGDARARPRPLPELAQALLVDVDDDDRPLRRDAGLDDLEHIEGAQRAALRAAPDR